MKKIIIFSLTMFFFGSVFSQRTGEKILANNTFEGTRVVVGHSVEMDREGDLNFLISHKFGRISDGPYEFFGLDQAIIRLGFDYAVKDWLTIGIGRSSLNKMADGFVKVKLLNQQTGKYRIPLTVTAISTAAATMMKSIDPNEPILIQNRFSYANQLLIARQFGPRFSIQLTPTHVHYNLVDLRVDKNDVIVIGAATKLQLTKSVAFKAEYFYTLPNMLPEGRRNSLAIGFDFDTGSHVFQTHLSNSGGLIEPAFIGDTTGEWAKGDIHFGFTIARVFRLKGRRY